LGYELKYAALAVWDNNWIRRRQPICSSLGYELDKKETTSPFYWIRRITPYLLLYGLIPLNMTS
jgi:hypothetical protein